MGLDHAVAAREVARLAQQVPALPVTFQRINQLVNDPRTSTAQLAEAVGADQGLATRLLRLANSSFYGLASRVDTMTQAVTIIGTRQVRDLSLAMAVLDLFRELPPNTLDGPAFWQHSLAVGSACRLLATSCRERETERHFVAGMLHDIGLVVLAQQQPFALAAHVQQAQLDRQPLTVIERRMIGFDHAELGGQVIEQWRLPTTLADTVRHHHHVMSVAHAPVDQALIHVADVVVEALAYGHGGEAVVPPYDPLAWDRLGLTPQVFAPLANDLERQMVELQAIFLA